MVRSRRGGPLALEHRRVVRALRAGAAPSGIASLRDYLGSPVPVLGVSTPRLRAVVRATVDRLAEAPRSRARSLARSLWRGRTFEERMVAIELLGSAPLAADEGAWRLETRWVDSATGWALSDSLAAGPIADQAAAHPERFRELLRWTRSPNLWRRRAAAYALRVWVRAGDLDRPFELLERLLDDRERWVQRAVGTWLRECWKKDQSRTEGFLRREVARLAPVTISVATERASRKFRDELRRRARLGNPTTRRGRRGL